MAAVGRSSGVIELASLGPVTSVCDLSMYVFCTLAIVASALVRDDTDEAASETTVGLTVASGLGILWGIILATPVTATPLLKVFLPSAVDPGVLPAALRYTRVRAFGFVGALWTVVLQSSLLVRRNVQVPLLAVTIASALNGLGDWVLCSHSMRITCHWCGHCHR